MESPGKGSAGEPAESIRSALSGRRDAIVGLAARLVSIPSHWPSHGEDAVVDALQDAAVALRLPRGKLWAAAPNRPNLLIRLASGSPGPVLLLNGHTDTKPPGDPRDWPADPLVPRLDHGILHGLGVADMKGALAAMLHAAAAIREAGLPRRGELLLAFTADEESAGTAGLAHLLRVAGVRPDMAIIGEPSGIASSFDTLCLGSRGFFGFTLRARGPRIHSALSDRLERRTAIAALARAIDRLPEMVDFRIAPSFPFLDGPTITVATSLTAGVAAGVDPGLAEAVGDVRTVPGLTRERVTGAIRAALDRIRAEDGGDLDVELVPDDEDWPWTAIEADEPVVLALERAARRVLGRSPTPGAFPGATEAHSLAALGIPCVPAFGPGLLRHAHVPGEQVAVEDLAAAAAIYALTAVDVLG
jgi:acetylornithine deacetylase/succinyl-diaminopimelate desuccinylase-like protein